MRVSVTRVLLPAVGLTLAAVMLVPTAGATSSTTRTIAGTSVAAGPGQAAVYFDNGTSVEDPYNGAPVGVSLTATARAGAIDVVVTLGAGPVQPFEDRAAGSYRIDAFVRVDGTPNTRGQHRLTGPVGQVAVAANYPLFPDGLVVRGTITGLSAGRHTLTLTDLLVDSSTPGSTTTGGFGGAPTGDDMFYSAGTGHATIVTRPTDWPVAQSVTVETTAPVIGLKVPAKPAKAKSWKKIKGTATDASGVKSVTVKLTQKRSDGKYFYNGKKWKKGKASKAKAVAAKVSGNSWSVSIKKPGKGKLTIKFFGIDKVGNTSKTKKYKATIT